ncbi:MAG: monovalent cation/H+ antiporter complex subunit F [Pseudonocardia sediminis]
MILLDIALGVMALAMVAAVVRLVTGPTDADRVLAVDFGFIVMVGSIALLAIRRDVSALLDLVLVATLVGFLATVALARLVRGRSPARPGPSPEGPALGAPDARSSEEA